MLSYICRLYGDIPEAVRDDMLFVMLFWVDVDGCGSFRVVGVGPVLPTSQSLKTFKGD